jgi:hypothetical protein
MLGKTSGMKVRRAFLFFILASLAILPTQIILTDATTPGGIADLELAGSLNTAAAILQHWGEENRWVVIASLVLDFPFLLAYTLLFFYLTRYVSERLRADSALAIRIGKAIGASFILAGVSDILENLALFALVFHTEDNAWALVAYYSALIKFSALGVGAVYLLLGGLTLFAQKLQSGKL